MLWWHSCVVLQAALHGLYQCWLLPREYDMVSYSTWTKLPLGRRPIGEDKAPSGSIGYWSPSEGRCRESIYPWKTENWQGKRLRINMKVARAEDQAERKKTTTETQSEMSTSWLEMLMKLQWWVAESVVVDQLIIAESAINHAPSIRKGSDSCKNHLHLTCKWLDK